MDLSNLHTRGKRVVTKTKSGATAFLTLDADLQRAAARLLKQALPRRGTIIAAGREKPARLLVWSERRGKRGKAVATSPTIPSASLFKIVTTAALLERGKGKSQAARLHQRWYPPHRTAPIWSHRAAGKSSVRRFRTALGPQQELPPTHSLSRAYLTRQDLIEVAERFGLNSTVAFDYRVPPWGTCRCPTTISLLRAWLAGFSGVTLSPLGALQLTHTVANGGRAAHGLRVVERAGAFQAPKGRSDLDSVISKTAAQQLSRMMEVTIHSGTSLDAFSNERGQSHLGFHRRRRQDGYASNPKKDAPTTKLVRRLRPEPRATHCRRRPVARTGRPGDAKPTRSGADLLRVYFSGRGARGVTSPFRRRHQETSPSPPDQHEPATTGRATARCTTATALLLLVGLVPAATHRPRLHPQPTGGTTQSEFDNRGFDDLVRIDLRTTLASNVGGDPDLAAGHGRCAVACPQR